MKRTVIALAALLAFAITVIAQRAPSPEAQLGAIINQAEGAGNYEAAIPLYKKFISENSKNKALAAKAQFHLAVAYEKLSKPEAQQAFQQLTRDYPNDPMAEAGRQKLFALASASGSASLSTQLIASPMRASSVSADGRFLAFSEGVSGSIGVHDTTTRQVTRPTATQTKISNERNGISEFPTEALISPDGRDIIYVWQRQGATNEFQLRIIPNHVNGQPRTLVDFGTSAYWILLSAWAPDRKSVLVTIIKQDDQTWQIARVSVSDGKLEVLRSLGWRAGNGLEIRPTFSPDGRQIVYAARADNPGRNAGTPEDPAHIYVLPADGAGPEVPLVRGANLNESPVWMPDGKTVLFVSNRGGDFGLWSVAVENGKRADPRLVKPDTGRISPIGFTRSGAFYYRTPRMTADKVSIVDTAAGNTSPTRGEPETILGLSPSWSPDGKQVALIRADQPVSSSTALDRLYDNAYLVVYSVEYQ
jgi:Tol biopolymer transport system component